MDTIAPLPNRTQKDRQISAFLHDLLNFQSNSWVFDFIEALPIYAIHMKDVRTGKFIAANTYLTSWCGLKSVGELIGITAREFWIEDVCHRRRNLHLDATVIRCEEYETARAEQLEAQVRSNMHSVHINRIFIKHDNSIRFENLIKLPIPCRNKKKVIALVTLTQDLTSQCELLELFKIYCQYCSTRRATELLLKYLEIDHYFVAAPTAREMQILLASAHHPNRKRIAKWLNVSHNTVASHIQHLKEFKLAKPDFDKVLIQLRQAHINKVNPSCAKKLDTPV